MREKDEARRKRRGWVITQRRRLSSTLPQQTRGRKQRGQQEQDVKLMTARKSEVWGKKKKGNIQGHVPFQTTQEPSLQSDSKRHFLTTNWPHKAIALLRNAGICHHARHSRPWCELETVLVHESFFLSPANISTSPPPPPFASLVVNSFSSGAGRGCLERLQAEKLSRKRIPPQHVIISLLEAKQLSQLFSLSHLAVLYTHRLSAGPLTPALLQHHTNVMQSACQLRPADLRRAQLLSAPCKTHSH